MSLPACTFGCLNCLKPHDHSSNEHHVLLHVTTAANELVEIAVNVLDEERRAQEMGYHIQNEDLPEQKSDEFVETSFSYRQKGLHDDDFFAATPQKLTGMLLSLFRDAESITVYGTTYSSGTGIHDIHMNRNESEGKDGAIGFAMGQAMTWLYFKFSTEHLD
jgi:hypothetical protein